MLLGRRFGGAANPEIKEVRAANGQANVAGYFRHKEWANYISWKIQRIPKRMLDI